MPELPEVETIKRSLEKNIAGQTIDSVELYMPKIIRCPLPGEFIERLTGKKILRMGRRGKYLLMHLSGGSTLVVHLRMTGRLVYSPPEVPLDKHTHAVFGLSGGRQLRYTDIRQFGRICLAENGELKNLPGLKDLGVEPLEEQFTRDYLKKELKRRRTRIKSLLLDQTIIAGLGNIYADEALFRAKVHPEKIASALTPREIAKLYIAIVEVLRESIENRGTSFRDYVDGEGLSGSNQLSLRVYSREGHPCIDCGKPLARIKVGGRSSYFCPCCQKA